MHFDSRRVLAEAIGTFFLVLIGPGAVMVNAYSNGAIGHVGIALSFAFVITAMVMALGHVSGAHLNPAVTLGLWSVRRFPAGDVLPYIGAQCVGAISASLALRSIVGTAADSGATLPTVPLVGATATEFLLSFVLMFVIMAVATDERVTGGVAGIAVGLTVGFCALMAGPLTGASMNPARSLGPAVVGGSWHAHWIYWVAPVAGMLAGARAYNMIRAANRPPTHERKALAV